MGPVTLTDPAGPVISGNTSSNPTTCLGSDGFISLSGLLPNTTYILSYNYNTIAQSPVTIMANGSGIITMNGLASGVYDNIVLTLNNCISNTIGPVTLTDPLPPVIVAGTNAPVCEGNTVNLTVTTINNAQYNWNGPGSYTATTQNPSITNAQINHSGQYIVTATQNNCTSEPDTVDVLVAPMPTVPVITNNGPLCAGNDIYLSSNTINGAIYNWTGPNSFTSNNEDPIIAGADETASGTYQVTAQIGTCVSGAATTTVVVNPGTPAPVAIGATYCQDETAVALTATGQDIIWYTLPTGGTGSPTAPIPSTTTAGTFSWYVSQTQNNCESPRTQVDVLVHPTPAMPIADSVFGYCQGAVATTLSATGQDVLWYTTSVGGTGNATAPTPQTNVPGIFKYYVTQTINGCESNRKEITVTINNKPNVPGVQNIEYCTGQTAVALTADGSNILWYANGSSTGDPAAPVPSTLVPDSIVWFVSQTVGGCESDQTPLTVLIHQQPTIELTASDNEICQYETVQFTSSILTGLQTEYEWVIPSSAEIVNGGIAGTAGIRFDNAGSFNVILKLNNRGCKAEDAVAINVKQAPVATISLPEHACMSDEVTVGIGYASTGINNYSWDFNGGTIIDSRSNAGPFTVKWTQPGTYIVKLTVSDGVCMSDRNQDTIKVHYLPDAGIKPVANAIVCSDDSIKVEAFTKESTWEYTWGPEAFFKHSNFGAIQYAQVRATSLISLTVKTEYGCLAKDSVFVQAQPCCDVYFPTAFSPNFDSRNDYFRPVTNGNPDLAVFVVKNRWGQTVFETISNNEVWDGTLNGSPLDIGVYYYYYKYKCEGKMRELKGEITLVR
jgi:gliding motility-associated-like protein